MHSRAPINRIYHLVWNPCPSGPAGFGQPSGGLALTACGRAWLAGALALSGGLLLAPAVLAGPQGATVSAGSGTVSQSGLNTTVQQSSQNLALNWQSFNLGANESLRFNQPNASSIVLNRITGQSPSQILGSISANGQVFVSNPNGVLFGSTAQVNVGGLVATTLGLSDADLMAKRYSFTATPGLPSASVSNQGTLSAADGGYLALLAPEVRNEGVLQARRGTALLAAGDKVTLHLNQGSLLSYAIDQGALNALADNRQLIQADGGRVFLSAKAANALTTAAVNNSGIIQARTAENVAGVIRLMGDMQTGTTTVSGTLDASAPNGGDGGSIETSAAHVRIASDARISTHANNGRVGSGLIDPLDFTIAASGGDISGATLSAALASTDVRIETGTGSVVCTGAACGVGSNGDGDIHVNDTVGWSSARTLTLSAWRNININQSISASHAAGKLALEYGQGAVNSGNTATYQVRAQINLMAGQNFSTLLGNDGAVLNYTVITTAGATGSRTTTDLQGISGDMGLNYVLGSNIDATGVDFESLGWGYSPYYGTFDGLGHTISHLHISQAGQPDIGLFGGLNAGATVRNVGLLDASVAGNNHVGALVGHNSGTVSNSYAIGNVVGGDNTGGLVGWNDGGTVTNSYAMGTVTGGGNVGGLVGSNQGTIRGSFATASVSGDFNLGGLVGLNAGGTGLDGDYGMFGSSGAPGANGGNSVIGDSYASGSVSGTGINVGALVGLNSGGDGGRGGNVDTGGIGGAGGAGGSASIVNSYATGTASSSVSTAGGLVGSNSTGNAGSLGYDMDNGMFGGVVGAGGAGGPMATVSNSFWNTSSGAAAAIGTGPGSATGLSSAQLQTTANFSSATAANGNANPGWDMANTWIVYNGHTAPLLRALMTELTVTADNVSKPFDGQAFTATGLRYSTTPNGNLLGTLNYGGASAIGSYAPSGLYSNQLGYIVQYVGGTLTITAAPVAPAPTPATSPNAAPNSANNGLLPVVNNALAALPAGSNDKLVEAYKSAVAESAQLQAAAAEMQGPSQSPSQSRSRARAPADFSTRAGNGAPHATAVVIRSGGMRLPADLASQE